MLTHDPVFLAGVRQAADACGALLIADEVATGFGRTGTMWACEQADVVPDLLTCGKGLTGGYLPLSAVLATEEAYESFLGQPQESRTFFHGHTYTANPLACAVAVANLDLMADRRTSVRAKAIGELLGHALEPLESVNEVHEVRRLGTMTGIELRRPDGTPYDRALRVGWRVCRRARDLGVIVRPLDDVVVLMPPLGISDDELQLLVDSVGTAIADTASGLD
jgi:adenosylmethionine-8-amino-7-oxononanoate aminotransferase